MNQMNLDMRSLIKGTVRVDDETLALHCLASITVHKIMGDKGLPRTYREIAEFDEHLKYSNNNLAFRYFVNFGEQGEKLLTNFLVKVYNYTEDEITEKVIAIADKIMKIIK